MQPDKFDWNKALSERKWVKVVTEKGNTLIGRVVQYTIIHGGQHKSSVHIDGICTPSNHQNLYECDPIIVVWFNGNMVEG